MTKVDFYILAGSGTSAREAMACKLIEKVYQLQHRVYVHTESQQDAQRLDELLWTFRPGSFIPHSIYSTGSNIDTPVVIGYQEHTPEIDDVMLNLTHEVPLFFSQFNRVAELVDGDENARTQARSRFKFYKDRGYELDTHDLANQ